MSAPRRLAVMDYEHLRVQLFDEQGNPDGFDWSPALAQLALDAANPFAAQITQTIDLRGEWTITEPFELVAHRSNIWGGCFRVVRPFADPSVPVVRVSGNYSAVHGWMHGYGLGGTPLKTRQNRTVFQIGDALDLVADGWEALTATHEGVSLDPAGNQIGAQLGVVHARDIGSAAGASPGHVARCDLAFTARVDDGSHGTHLQTSRLSIDIVGEGYAGHLAAGQPWFHTDANGVVQVGTIQAVSETGGYVEVFPKLATKDQQTGTLTPSYGAALRAVGQNNVGASASVVHGLRVGQLRVVGVNGGADGCLIAEDGTGVALRWPATNGGTTRGYAAARLHAEGMVAAHLLDVGRSTDAGVVIGATSGVDLDRCWSLSPLRPDDPTTTADDHLSGVQNHTYETFLGVGMFHGGAWLTTPAGTEIGSEATAANASISAHPSHRGAVPPVLRQNTPIISLLDVPGLERWGHSSARLSVVGADGGQPSQITLKSTPEHGEIEPRPGQTDPYLRVVPLPGGADVLIYRDAGLWRVRVLPFV